MDHQQTAAPLDADAALTELFGHKTALSAFRIEDFARRFVATVDNLGRSHAPVAAWPINPTPGRLVVETKDRAEVIGTDNGLRYTAFVLLLETVDLRKAVATYARLYPQLQQAYEDLGFPKRYFNDRPVEVIDLLLATPNPDQSLKVSLPQINGPLQPERPWVLYEFEETALQSLAAGQKILLRMGPVNERRMKGKLLQIRRLVTRVCVRRPGTAADIRTPQARRVSPFVSRRSAPKRELNLASQALNTLTPAFDASATMTWFVEPDS